MQKPREGVIPNFTVINSPYEAPVDPEIQSILQIILLKRQQMLSWKCLKKDSNKYFTQ